MRSKWSSKAAVIVASLGLAYGSSVQGTERVTTNVASDLLILAIEDARQTLPLFFSAWEMPAQGQSNFTISVRMVKPDGFYELVWLTNIVRISPKKFSGLVNPKPVFVVGVELGDVIEFATEEVTDWAYWDQGMLHGAYTTRLSLRGVNTEEAREWQRKFAPLP